MCTLMFRITQLPQFSFFLVSTYDGTLSIAVVLIAGWRPWTLVVAAPPAVILDHESWMDILVDSSSYYRHMHLQTFGLPML